MTKLEKLKQDIGYTKENSQCQNCKYFSSILENGGWNNSFIIEKDIRCTKYNFVTKKTTVCNEYERKV